MMHTTDTLTAATGAEIFTQSWLPENDIQAVLVIAHGLSEHSGRYLPFVHYFVERNYAVYALDHEGHGQSGGMRGHINHFDDFVETLNVFIDRIEERHAGKKIFLVGHSMGGAISVNYLLKYQQRLAGCLLSGAALSVGQVISPFQQQVLRFFSLVLPRVPLIKIEGEAVSRDPAVVEAYENDPLVYRGKATARLLAEIVSAAKRGLLLAGEISLPLFIMHGGGDLLTSPSGSEELYEKVASTDKTLKIYDGLYHEIFLEEEKYEVFADIEEWLIRHH
jgi:alpha-beta hydrolase superfamily lysophospholipase